MFNQPRILVCTDFSEASDRALKAAAKLAKETSGKVSLLHVAQFPWFLNISESGIIAEELSEQYTKFITENCQYHFKKQQVRCDVKTETILHFDMSLMKAVRATISGIEASLVVLGNKGSTNEDHFSLGSFVKKLCSSSSVPVLVIKNEKPISKVAALVDGNEDFRGVVDWATELTYIFGGRLEIISLVSKFPGLYQFEDYQFPRQMVESITKQSEKEIERIENRIKDALCGQKGNILVKSSYEKNVASHLVEIMQDEDVNLAVLKRHDKNAVEKFFLGSVSNNVVENFNGNILIF